MADITPHGYEKLAGSERKPLAHARPLGPVDPHEKIEVSVYLRAPASEELRAVLARPAQSPERHLTRQEYSENYGASSEDVAKVEQFAREHDLTIVEKNVAARKVVLAGTAAAMSRAFATRLQKYEHPDGTFRGRSGPLHVPRMLDQVVVGVFGLDDRPQASTDVKRYRPMGQANAIAYTPPQLARYYDFPANANGTGQCIAIIELGGGFTSSDLQTYFQQLNVPFPQVTSLAVDGGHNLPIGEPQSADGEVYLDIEVAGAIAPGARIAVYFAPNTDRGFLDAITQAIHDSANAPSVLSISWGSAEASWTAQAMQVMDQAFQTAAALGITICCAAGDTGSADGLSDGQAHVDFPASSPYALACGGTRLVAANGSITSERAWNDSPTSSTGGGISDYFPVPAWQAQTNIPPSVNDGHKGRGMPDVAGNADPQTGYMVHADGQDLVLGGTSAVAPLWAALIALINQQQGKSVGYLNPILYQHYDQLVQANALRDITSGDNGAYAAGVGWDACTGVGTPDGANLLKALQSILSSNSISTL